MRGWEGVKNAELPPAADRDGLLPPAAALAQVAQCQKPGPLPAMLPSSAAGAEANATWLWTYDVKDAVDVSLHLLLGRLGCTCCDVPGCRQACSSGAHRAMAAH